MKKMIATLLQPPVSWCSAQKFCVADYGAKGGGINTGKAVAGPVTPGERDELF
jgi:hypothetical protein